MPLTARNSQWESQMCKKLTIGKNETNEKEICQETLSEGKIKHE